MSTSTQRIGRADLVRNPQAPGADWRLVWLGETEDGLAAWFVRPLAVAALETMGARA